jgi:hypothetical protein
MGRKQKFIELFLVFNLTFKIEKRKIHEKFLEVKKREKINVIYSCITSVVIKSITVQEC